MGDVDVESKDSDLDMNTNLCVAWGGPTQASVWGRPTQASVLGPLLEAWHSAIPITWQCWQINDTFVAKEVSMAHEYPVNVNGCHHLQLGCG